MRIRVADPLDAVATPAHGTTSYRVRGWNRPDDGARSAWATDEWDIFAAESVDEVLEWARDLPVDACEVFVQWDDHAQSADGRNIVQRRFTRVYGTPADNGGVSETVIFVSKD
jgi:hypothetical protein